MVRFECVVARERHAVQVYSAERQRDSGAGASDQRNCHEPHEHRRHTKRHGGRHQDCNRITRARGECEVTRGLVVASADISRVNNSDDQLTAVRQCGRTTRATNALSAAERCASTCDRR